MSIRVAQLQKQYEDQKVLEDVSFDLRAGEITGFVGPNGAGKSTTMKIITGLLQADSGEVFIEDEKITHYTPRIKSKIGYLAENNPLYTDMYVQEYLRFLARLHRLPNTRARISEGIEMVGLGVERNKKIGQLSKGYRQRVGLAAALLHNPSILILDEPTSGLDPNQVIAIRELIRTLGKEKTVLFSTHALSEVEALCSKIIVINRGCIIARDTPQGLRHREREMILEVTFGEAHGVEDFAPLATDYIDVSAGGRAQVWTFSVREKSAFMQSLMKLCVANMWTILEVKERAQSLEDMFASLTKS